ncbi:MAG TPA: type II toxin-antitoxin system VapC family toxin [Thermoanaerobaculia bacterium]
MDSSGWLEFFGDGPFAEEYAARLKQPQQVLTATVALYEVYKWIKRERTEEEALAAVATMQKTRIAPLTDEIALAAADLSLANRLAMADAIMLATARANNAELWTSDSDFAGIAGVTVLAKK